MRFNWLAVLALLLPLFACSCMRELPIELVKLEEVLPRSVERGDHLEVRGAGFPQGRTARVTLRGTLHRPGLPAESSAIVTEGTVVAPTLIDVLVDEHLEALFCGNGADADHTTFSGDLEIAFAARAASSAPIGATLSNVTLDMHPAVLDSHRLAGEADNGKRTLAYLGIESVDVTSAGLVARGVVAGSRGDVLGISAGDLITSFGGLHTSEVRDLSASMLGPVVPLTFLRTSGREETRELNVVSLSGAAPPDLSVALAAMASLVLFALLFVVPLRVPFASFESGLSRRARAAFVMRGASLYGPALSALLVLVVTVAPAPFSEALDVTVLVPLVLGLTLLDAIERSAGTSAMWRTVGSAMLEEAAPLLAVVALSVASSGIGLFDAARAQGALPWHWIAFKSPLALVLVAVVVTSRFARAPARVTSFGALATSLLAFVLVLEAFGGGAVARSEASSSVASAVLVATKTWMMTAMLLAAPKLGAAMSARTRTRLAWKVPLAVAAVILAMTVVCVRFDLSVTLLLRERSAIIVVALVFAAFARISMRATVSSRGREPHADPFI